MSLQNTPSSERVHISLFGNRNAGKSSLINALTGQDLAIVSEIKGTTTDPVQKAMELLPLGPVVIIDTPGLNDTGEIGALRVKKTYQVLNKTDIALLVVDINTGFQEAELEILELIKEKEIPYLVVYNKSDLKDEAPKTLINPSLVVSAKTGDGIEELKNALGALAPALEKDNVIAADLVTPGDLVLLVVPIDSAAPKGRLILPQQQTIRDLLDHGNLVTIVKEDALESALTSQAPALIITDSQVFGTVSRINNRRFPLTSFSILFARYKGDLEPLWEGAKALDSLTANSKILISEGCTHHRQCDDIGTVKLPRWLKEYTKEDLTLSFTSGSEFPQNLNEYDLIIHCGGCMLNEKEMKYRIAKAQAANVPITNYGMAIAQMKGILAESLAPLAKQK
ncbi:[FeFe] hydrogenase H-cluster maturation GTPase HydF [Lachnospiraceae bacterium PF1-21]|uniref:[FeFe] hydrogenase H-cluster maturation GTPase HydF n=1 Tax=Ohessyouella blattaphilus TaxID=2949333 RepID=A0ABT1EDV3_9FIRM|nr:[FeFe] hydrogenase H-cluster maturation GTPase HydF [Ohessyouella blattaphilus]MCP1108892.1 [FeFe] hydrogenase H-cluster maturation GTPase HydF [Ohessyouella blattaphilus]MCR8562286.1 [FeFe] hydrogenase H-cluster maturation GTPase HydF [Ohessyouella blattaphilus]MDL2249057.1 [FeFe] hydrogenase H-cluster maturation GTPase HydF [Lachnospiraceae bacterium OttesenSCG-928-J05]